MRPKSGPLGVIWVPRDCLFPLPVEEKAISGLSGNARDGLFPLPVEEKAISGLTRKALGVLGGRARDGLFPLPVEERAIMGLKKEPPWPQRRLGLSYCIGPLV